MEATSPSASLAPRRAPEAYVRAEVASFPLTSLQAFEEALITLDPALREGEPTLHLWRACEDMLVQHGAGWSLDRIVAARDRTWFDGGSAPMASEAQAVHMHEYLRRLAHAHLERWPGTTLIKQHSDLCAIDAVGHYRWLTFALPEDLLLSAVEVAPPPQRASLDPPLLVHRLLDRGVAEIHLHAGAGMDYPMLWAAGLASLADPSLKRDALKGPGLPFDDGNDLVQWLLAAAVARVIVAEYLICRDMRANAPESLSQFIDDVVGRPSWSTQRRRALIMALGALVRGRWPDDGEVWFSPLRDLYAELHPAGVQVAEQCPETVDEVWRRCDPIAARLDLGRPGGGERFLVASSLDYLASTQGQKDQLFARVFWQALRVRCQHYRIIVQRPMTAGLQWFVRFSARISTLREPLRNVHAEAAYRTAGTGSAIAAIELRKTPEESPTRLARELHGFVHSWRRVLDTLATRERPPEMGVVFHFAKERHPGHRWEHGSPPAFWMGTHAEPRTREHALDVLSSDGRFVDFFASRQRQARALGDLLRAVPDALWVVRGLDVANDELAVPTWVMVPLYHAVLDQANHAAARGIPNGPPSLRFTAHVGEDYRHLMEGLRRVYECIHYILLGAEGSRLGHATALGVEPRWWAQSVGSTTVPAEERLMDLVFEWRLYTRYRVRPEFGAAAPPARTEQIANLIREISEQVFGKSHEPEHLAELHHVLHGFLVPPLYPLTDQGGLDTFHRAVLQLRRTRASPSLRRSLPQHISALLQRYLEDERVFRRGQLLIDVTIDSSEIAALDAVQQALRFGVAANGIIVEVNPSSNLLIGDILDLRNHPLLRLYPVQPNERLVPVSIAVGSDDPVTFSTHLLREYTLLYEAARTAGYADRVVVDWLESVRQSSMDARFTLAWPPSAHERAASLIEAFERYLELPHRTAYAMHGAV